ncbi:hypothetical protein D3C86_2039090 [compost metagenome]
MRHRLFIKVHRRLFSFHDFLHALSDTRFELISLILLDFTFAKRCINSLGFRLCQLSNERIFTEISFLLRDLNEGFTRSEFLF